MAAVILVDQTRHLAPCLRRSELIVSQANLPGASWVINWSGRTELEAKAGQMVFNRPEAVHMAARSEVRRAFWRSYGLRVARRRGRLFYRVHVFDLRVLRVYRIRRLRFRTRVRRVATRGSKRMQALMEAAVRAVYALRLDFGIVDLVLGRKEAAVVAIKTTLPTRGPLAKLYLNAAEQSWRAWHAEVADFAIGADPEFLVMTRRSARLVIASRYLSRHGVIGVDDQRLTGSRTARPIAELRPRPENDPSQLVRNMQRLLLRMPRALRRRRYGWYAGSGRAPYHTGGHVHFSGLPLTGPIIRALDTYLALPFLLIENPVKARRRRAKYGRLGEVRRKRWGFEYRTPPSWLVAPRFAEAALILAKLIGKNWQRLTRDVFQDPKLVAAFHRADKAQLYPYIDDVIEDLKALPDYPHDAECLQTLWSLIAQRLRWNEERDFCRQWGLR